MCQKHFYLYLLVIITSVHAQIHPGNGSSCDNFNVFNSGRQFRGLEFVNDDKKWLQSKREPRLFSFSTEEQDVAIRMEFGVPFITIPTKRTIDGLRSFAYNVMQGEIPKPIFNLPALTLIGLLCLTFSTLGSAIRNLNQKAYEAGKAPNIFSQRSDFEEPSDDNDFANLWTVLDKFDKTLAKYNIDTVACVQRSICLQVQESKQKILEKTASKLDVVIDGIARTDWMLNFISETAIEDAINIAKQHHDCERAFPTCVVNLRFFYSSIQTIVSKVM